MNKNNQKGFSLVELLVVVAIIGILAAVGVVTYNGYIGNARISAAKASHNSIVAFATAEAAKCSIDISQKFAAVTCKSFIEDVGTKAAIGVGAGAAKQGGLLAAALKAYVDINFKHTFDSSKAAVSAVGALTCTAAAHAGDIAITASGTDLSVVVSTCWDPALVSPAGTLVSGNIGIY